MKKLWSVNFALIYLYNFKHLALLDNVSKFSETLSIYKLTAMIKKGHTLYKRYLN